MLARFHVGAALDDVGGAPSSFGFQRRVLNFPTEYEVLGGGVACEPKHPSTRGARERTGGDEIAIRGVDMIDVDGDGAGNAHGVDVSVDYLSFDPCGDVSTVGLVVRTKPLSADGAAASLDEDVFGHMDMLIEEENGSDGCPSGHPPHAL